MIEGKLPIVNAVEIEQAVSELAEGLFDPEEFPFAFLRAFGNKDTTIQRLRRGDSNKSDIGGVLQVNNIHLCIAAKGEVTKVLEGLRESPATTKAKAKFILATDGETLEAEDLTSGDTVACSYREFPNHFGFFLPLAGISTVPQITENAFDIRATSRLNRLYVELLKTNPEWGIDRHAPWPPTNAAVLCGPAPGEWLVNLFPLALRTALQMLCIVGMVALAPRARAELVTWDYTLYPPLEAVMTGGDDSRIYTENRAPQYVLTRFVVNGASATEWQEAFEVLNTMRRDEPRKPKQWLERLRKERDAACPGEWHIIAEDHRSLTFERRTPDCPPHAAQTALYRVIYGPQQVFTLIATVKVDIPAESRTAWLEVLASADVRP